jgi:hypothetical protein
MLIASKRSERMTWRRMRLRRDLMVGGKTLRRRLTTLRESLSSRIFRIEKETSCLFRRYLRNQNNFHDDIE